MSEHLLLNHPFLFTFFLPQDEVAPKHVKEAFRLLNKSIVRVEQPDVQLEGEEEPLGDVEEEPMEEADAENVAPPVNGQVNGDVPHKEKEKEKKKKLKLSFEEYKAIANLLVLHLRYRKFEENIGLKLS